MDPCENRSKASKAGECLETQVVAILGGHFCLTAILFVHSFSLSKKLARIATT